MLVRVSSLQSAIQLASVKVSSGSADQSLHQLIPPQPLTAAT
jgi:hypothetical protein